MLAMGEDAPGENNSNTTNGDNGRSSHNSGTNLQTPRFNQQKSGQYKTVDKSSNLNDVTNSGALMASQYDTQDELKEMDTNHQYFTQVNGKNGTKPKPL